MKPNIIFTSVVRGTKKGESHGGIYLLNLENQKYQCVFDWNYDQISFDGRGGDRGLRGICFHNGLIYIAASNELFVFNQKFEIVKSYTNEYLRDCHEISRLYDSIYVSSTATNSILEFDINQDKFSRGYKLFKTTRMGQREFLEYDPNNSFYKESKYRWGGDHINSIFCKDDRVYFSGLYTKRLFALNLYTKDLEVISDIPMGTHNVRPYHGGLLMNYTDKDQVIFTGNKKSVSWNIKKYPTRLLTGLDAGVARQSFGRGLCVWKNLIIGGSSPATISVYDLDNRNIETIMISKDIRNAIHGLEVWPFKTPNYL